MVEMTKLFEVARNCAKLYIEGQLTEREQRKNVTVDKNTEEHIKYGFYAGTAYMENELRHNLWKDVTEEANRSYLLLAQCKTDDTCHPCDTVKFQVIDNRMEKYDLPWNKAVEKYGIIKWCYIRDIE